MKAAEGQLVNAASNTPPETEGEVVVAPIITASSVTDLDQHLALRKAAAALGTSFHETLAHAIAAAEFLEKIPIGFARQHAVLGLASDNGHLPVAISDVSACEELEVIARFLGRPVKPVFATRPAILAAINVSYQQKSGEAQTFIEKLDRRDVLSEIQELHGREDLLDVATRAPVIKLVNLMLFEAVKLEASDIHLQPYDDKLVIRLRIDGVLFDAFDLPKALQEEVLSRVKVMGKMNIAEKRLAQDGRATVQVGDRIIDLRIASLPTSCGERIVVRLLDKSARLYTLGELGMPPGTLSHFQDLIGVEHGLLLVTGPTGSGKSTTLYAALQELNHKELNILTLEDPIEYQLPGVSQTQVNEKKGMTFASGLRNVLRQDPDIIMVGEIRDRETAVMAIQSALTGHLVFSTLHTNDAASAVTRLLDLGIEPYLVASSVIGVLAQRLVRKVCSACGQPIPPSTDELRRLGIESPPTTTSMRFGPGCDACRKTGYKGRVGIFELMLVDHPVRKKIQEVSTAADIKDVAIQRGMKTLHDDGVDRALRGVTTIEEVLRVTMRATV